MDSLQLVKKDNDTNLSKAENTKDRMCVMVVLSETLTPPPLLHF